MCVLQEEEEEKNKQFIITVVNYFSRNEKSIFIGNFISFTIKPYFSTMETGMNYLFLTAQLIFFLKKKNISLIQCTAEIPSSYTFQKVRRRGVMIKKLVSLEKLRVSSFLSGGAHFFRSCA